MCVLRRRGWIAVVLLLAAGCSSDDPAGPAAPEPTLAESLDAYIDARQNSSDPGLAVLVRRDGQLVYRRTVGRARPQAGTDIDRRTGFRLASLAKPITALAVMALRDDGDLALGDPVRDYLPELPESYADVTIEHLLTHRAGIPDYIDDNTDVTALDQVRSSELLALIPGSGLDVLRFAPGTQGDYSNTGYALLALVVERASGQTYPDFVRARVFEPAGMTDSWVIDGDRRMGDAAANHAWSNASTPEVLGFDSWIYGANGVVASLDDVEALLDALRAATVIPAATLSEMVGSRGEILGVGRYGYGWITGEGSYWHSSFSRPGDYFHTGGFDGYRTLMLIGSSADGFEIVVLSNGGNATQETMFGIANLVRARVAAL